MRFQQFINESTSTVTMDTIAQDVANRFWAEYGSKSLRYARAFSNRIREDAEKANLNPSEPEIFDTVDKVVEYIRKKS